MTKYAVTLRALETGDMGFIEHVYATSRALEMTHSGWPAEQIASFLKMQFNAQHQYYQQHFTHAEFCIVEADGERAGRLYTYFGRTCAVLIDIALLPHYQKHGIGSGLLEALLRRSDQLQLPVELSVEPYNPALQLYQRFGFQVIDQKGVYLRMRREAPDHPSRMPS
ncbi:GNAT family N-acetyltransferase [Pantoea sp. Tr-811]|uniref:GNAT family N-acetyltransferase n=1 Tax=Pantoea sp. Tr-811 TaxID=2608361 RepID=UPI00141ECBD3|nr:GNAT family N-acetyltransferase [Pantoea sp. Tr-811]NIF30166.1 GNAT family N-acetyltransferase [Pantoea sp. Tr-811]